MIKISNLKKRYDDITALDGISFEVPAGKITGLVGPNGCGKSTLIKSILGLVIPDEGDIFVDDQSIKSGCDYRQNIGYMPQNPEFPSNLSIKELFALSEDVRGMAAPLREKMFYEFDLQAHGDKSFNALSGGTKQKVAAVAAFMFKPRILILDEPTVGLDPVSAMQFKKMVRQMADEGCAVLLVSHLMTEVEQMVDRVVFVLDGKVSFSGSTQELMAITGVSTNLENAVVQMIKAGTNEYQSQKSI